MPCKTRRPERQCSFLAGVSTADAARKVFRSIFTSYNGEGKKIQKLEGGHVPGVSFVFLRIIVGTSVPFGIAFTTQPHDDRREYRQRYGEENICTIVIRENKRGSVRVRALVDCTMMTNGEKVLRQKS